MMMNQNNLKGPANPRYKTSLCKNFNSAKGCQYGEKCQFAHGEAELRQVQNNMQMMNQPQMMKQLDQYNKNMMNYKIVKCKNFEKDGKCKYGDRCSFAHGDSELRTKDPSLQQPMMIPFGMPNFYEMMKTMNPAMMGMPPNFDYSQMPMMDPNFFIMQQQMMQNPPVDPNQAGAAGTTSANNTADTQKNA